MKRNLKIGFAIVTFVATALWGASTIAAPKSAVELDPFGIEPLYVICDLREGAPISDKCYGFVAGVAESLLAEEVVAEPGRRRFCPRHVKIPEMIAAIRHRFRGFNCAGLCTSASYVAGELYRDYPCR